MHIAGKLPSVNRTPLGLLLAVVLPVAAAGTLVISEFMADNEGTVADGWGRYPDWIEIHNPTSQPVDLAGWQLRDRQGLRQFRGERAGRWAGQHV